MTQTTTVAFIGLGVMGCPMAGHLSKKGFITRVYNRNAEKSAAWTKEYAGTAHATPREAAVGADVVSICVGNDNDLRSIVLGADGVLAGMKKGAVIMDHTTASASVAIELHALCAEKGVGFIDAPVSGGQAGAVNGALTIMCGGNDADFALAHPVAMAYAKVLGATNRQDGYLEGNGYLVSWCVGHLVELAPPNVYDAKYVKWSIADLPILPQKWQYLVSAGTKKQFSILQKLMHRPDVDSIVNSCDAGQCGWVT